MNANEIQGLWIAFSVLTTACGGGFVFLLVRVMSNNQRINESPNYKYINDEFYRKEMVDTHLKNIDKELASLTTSINQMLIKMDKIFIHYLKEIKGA
jgi:hypothetical protein